MAANLVTKLPNSLSTFITKSYFKGTITKSAKKETVTREYFFKYLINKVISNTVTALKQVGIRGSHCSQQLIQQDKMKVKILPALSDNYMYLVSLFFHIQNLREINF